MPRNLKYLKSGWDWGNKDLFYVSFQINNQILKWYPRWQEIDDLFSTSVMTETYMNGGAQNDLFEKICLDNLKRIRGNNATTQNDRSTDMA